MGGTLRFMEVFRAVRDFPPERPGTHINLKEAFLYEVLRLAVRDHPDFLRASIVTISPLMWKGGTKYVRMHELVCMLLVVG